MRSLLPILCLCWLLGACSTPAPEASTPIAPSISDKAWSLIEAQDRRGTPELIVLLTDSAASLRARAALALASVGDSSAIPALLHALNDEDPLVRANAAFAFGFCGDSVHVHQLIERYSPEENAAVRGRIAEATGRCGRRAGADLLLRRQLSAKADTLGVLRGLFFATTTGSTDTSHIRYALSLFSGKDAERDEAVLQVCARAKAELVKPFSKRLLAIAHTMPDTGSAELRMPLLSALGKTGSAEALALSQGLLVRDPDPRIRVMALRAIARYEEPGKNEAIWNALMDTSAMVRDLAVEQMRMLKELPDDQSLWTRAQEHDDLAVKIPLCGMVMKAGDEPTRSMCRMLLRSMDQQDLGPYLKAELTKARWADSDTARTIMLGSAPAVVRLAAMETWLTHFAEALRTKEVTKALRDLSHGTFLKDALNSGDAGLIAAACEKLLEEDRPYLQFVLDVPTITAVRKALHPIRDLEALQMLEQALAERNDLPTPKHASPPFNHPIDRVRLGALVQGQQYRLTTSQGDIILALEPEAAPGSCAAFDSLVSAGYYNGRYFHRVVPDFVAQGGCPRGDGYGAMDWTLRTEVGLEGFVTGAVGLASAGKDTESCQFFIMLADAPHLDGRYTRFAHVVSGMDVAWRLRVGDVIRVVERMR